MNYELSPMPSHGSAHEHCPNDDKRDAEELPHVEEHTALEVHLYIFGIFYEEAESEDVEKAKSEVEACAWVVSLTFFYI